MRRAALCLMLIGLTVYPRPVGACWSLPTEPVPALVNVRIVRGTGGGKLELHRPLSRAELAVIALRVTRQEDFLGLVRDIPLQWPDGNGHWAANHLRFVQALKLFSGYPDGRFYPDAPATRAEVITAIARALDIQAASGHAWPENYLQAAHAAGLAPPDQGVQSDPSAPLTRSEAFTLIDAMLRTVRFRVTRTWYQELDCGSPLAPTT